MNLKNFIEGVTTLTKYCDQDSYQIGAGHDQFYFYATARPVSKEDYERLIELGWFQPDIRGDEYDPVEGWSCFT